MFDPNDFLNATTTDVGSTNYEPVPEDEYNAVIDKLEAKAIDPKNPGDAARALINLTWKLDAPGNDLANGKFARQTLWLDLTDSGSLDMGKGKNVQLNRVRDALGQNDGRPWNPAMMQGSVARVKTKNSEPNDSGAVFTNVVAVAKA